MVLERENLQTKQGGKSRACTHPSPDGSEAGVSSEWVWVSRLWIAGCWGNDQLQRVAQTGQFLVLLKLIYSIKLRVILGMYTA